MRLLLRHLTLFLTTVMVVTACNKEPQTNITVPNDDEKIFVFSNKQIKHTELSLDIMPHDQEAEYVVLFAEKKHFIANGIDTDEELIEDDLAMLRNYAEYYGITIREFLEGMKWLVKGNKEGYKVTNLYPNTEYVVYCYGVDVDGENYVATTDICYEVITTTAPELQKVEFDIATTISGNNVEIVMTPNNYNGLYYSYIVPETDSYYLPDGAEFNADYLAHYRNTTWATFNELINNQGTPAEQFCHSGTVTRNERLNPNANYMAICFAVSDEQTPILCSEPTIKYFTTEQSNKSDLTIKIEVTDITQYNAMLTVTPSKKSEEYACVFLAASQLPPYESEYEQMMFIIENFDPAIFSGPFSEALTPLMPGTEYVVVAFGIENDLPTTDMFSYRFSSLEAGTSEVYIESIEMVKLFDVQEIIALDSSYSNTLAECECVAIVEAKTNIPSNKLRFWWYEEWMRVEYSEEAFLEDLLMYEYANNPEIMDMYYSMNDQDRFLFAGIAEDESGNMSEIFYSEPFLMSKDMCDPAEEFFTYIPQSNQSAILTFKR
ncbi:MAG: hypothetical protein J6U69_01835 [Alistipes sp.]|nr:hypothetical protein [Alistipes sp.]